MKEPFIVNYKRITRSSVNEEPPVTTEEAKLKNRKSMKKLWIRADSENEALKLAATKLLGSEENGEENIHVRKAAQDPNDPELILAKVWTDKSISLAETEDPYFYWIRIIPV